MSLTDIKAAKKCKTLEKEYKLTDGFGMFLRVTLKGSEILANGLPFRRQGKQKLFLSVFTLLFLFLTQDNAT